MSIMSGLGDKVSQKPKAVIAIIIVLTLVFGYFAMSFQSEVDPSAFNPDHELIEASEEAGDLFGTSEYTLLILAKAKDGNLLEIDDLKAMVDLESDLRNDSLVSSAILPSQTNPTGFTSPADLLVLSFNLIESRLDIDSFLFGLDFILHELLDTLQNNSIPNTTKGTELMLTLNSISENLSLLQGQNGFTAPTFDRNVSLETLNTMSLAFAPDPVSGFLNFLKTYDAEGSSEQTTTIASIVNESITQVLPYMTLLQGMPLDPVNGSAILMGLQFALPTMEAGGHSLDRTIVGMYFGVTAMMSGDFTESEGTQSQGSMIFINLDPTLNKKERSRVENRIHDITEEKDGNIKYGVFGNELINEEIQETMDVSQILLMVLVVVLIVIILFITFRSGFDTALTIGSLLMAIIWSYGVSRMVGMQGSIIAQVVPILLVGLGVDYGIHMTMRFREEKGKNRKNAKAIAIAISTVGMALLLATITTSIGFMSNTVSSLSILREFAVMVTIGIASSFIIMTTFLPAMKLVFANRRDKKGKKKKKKKKKSKKHHVSLVTIGAKAGDRAPWAVIIILILISSGAGYAASQLKTEFDFRDFLPKETEAYENFIYLIDEFPFGNEENGNYYIKGDITQPEVLLAINDTITRTYDDAQVHPELNSWSILSVLNKYANPTSALEFNGSFISEASHNDLVSVLHYDPDTDTYDAAFVQLRVNSENLKKADVLVDELTEDAQPLLDLEEDGTIDKVWILGEPVLNSVIINEMNDGQIRSIMITILASFIVLTVVFYALERSFILGLITVIPVGLVILWILGTMLFLGYDLNVMTITIASLTVGMGITYSIHITERFTEDLKHIKNVGKACENTLRHTGMALAGAFLTTSGGFGVLYFHKLPPLQQFGVLIALSIAYSFLSSAYVLPTFLILWAKWRKRYRAKSRKKGKDQEKDKKKKKDKKSKKESEVEGSDDEDLEAQEVDDEPEDDESQKDSDQDVEKIPVED
jgi:hydrophobe/amphiphile efflux-3 (HAE3) family protein